MSLCVRHVFLHCIVAHGDVHIDAPHRSIPSLLSAAQARRCSILSLVSYTYASMSMRCDADAQLKAFRFKDGAVHWELRRPLLFIFPRKVLDLHHLLSRDLLSWVQEARRRFGDSCLVRSHKAIVASGVELDGDHYTQSEWICSGSALILLLF